MEYHIKRCLAPCAEKISREDYWHFVKAAEKFLEGKTSEVERELTSQMNEAAESLNFELAAKLRDVLLAVKKIGEKQKIVTDSGDLDAIGIARLGSEVCAQIFFVREGKVTGRESFVLKGTEGAADAQIVAEFVKQYYSRAKISVKEVLMPTELSEEDSKIFGEWLGAKFIEPKRGIKKSLVDMANENAEKFLSDAAARDEIKKRN